LLIVAQDGSVYDSSHISRVWRESHKFFDGTKEYRVLCDTDSAHECCLARAISSGEKRDGKPFYAKVDSEYEAFVVAWGKNRPSFAFTNDEFYIDTNCCPNLLRLKKLPRREEAEKKDLSGFENCI